MCEDSCSPVCRHDNVDIVVIRENTEGEYSGLEHEVGVGVCVCVCVCRAQITGSHWRVSQVADMKTWPTNLEPDFFVLCVC